MTDSEFTNLTPEEQDNYIAQGLEKMYGDDPY